METSKRFSVQMNFTFLTNANRVVLALFAPSLWSGIGSQLAISAPFWIQAIDGLQNYKLFSQLNLFSPTNHARTQRSQLFDIVLLFFSSCFFILLSHRYFLNNKYKFSIWTYLLLNDLKVLIRWYVDCRSYLRNLSLKVIRIRKMYNVSRCSMRYSYVSVKKVYSHMFKTHRNPQGEF